METSNDWQATLQNIWESILKWFEDVTGWLDPLLKPTTNTWWEGAFEYFNTFPVILQLLFVGLGIVLLIMGLIALIKKSLKLVIVLGIIVVIFMVLNG